MDADTTLFEQHRSRLFGLPIPGTTQMAHLLENIGATQVSFSSSELQELNAAVAAIEIHGERLPEAVLVHSGREAPVR